MKKAAVRRNRKLIRLFAHKSLSVTGGYCRMVAAQDLRTVLRHNSLAVTDHYVGLLS